MVEGEGLESLGGMTGSSSRAGAVAYMSRVIRNFRETLWNENFLELNTPILRASDSSSSFRRVRLSDGRFLRDSPAFALRRNLEFFPKIFELGQCFRNDSVDSTHLQQFTMLDLYHADSSLEDAIGLCGRLVRTFYLGEIEFLSFPEFVKAEVDVDYYGNPEATTELIYKISKSENDPRESLDAFIKERIEPLSIGKAIFVMNFPLLAEPTARRMQNAIALGACAELHINGVEIVNIIEDEATPSFIGGRGARQDPADFGNESDLIADLVQAGTIPARSAGFGIGIERLCVACRDNLELSKFVASPEFSKDADLLGGL